MKLSPAQIGLRIVLGAIGLAAILYGGTLAYVWSGQERLLFHPTTLPADYHFDRDRDVHERWVDVPGARLDVLHLELPHPDGVVFFLHGNSDNLETWFVSAEFYRALNLDLVMFDYRGFGKSTGWIESQAQLFADMRAVWAAFAPQYEGKRHIVYGRSLGSGLAAQLAAEVQPELTVLVSPYESMIALAHEKYPAVPAALLRYPLRSDLALARVKGPVLLFQGLSDTVISPDHSRRLQRIKPDATLVFVPNAGHGDIHKFAVYLDALRVACGAPLSAAGAANHAAPP